MTVTAQPIPMLTDNYAWLLHETTSGATAFVDPADADAAIAATERNGGRLDMIVLTHHHADHTAGTSALRARYGCPVIGAARDERRLPALDRAVRAGDTVRLGTATAEIIDTPGHTIGHIAYFFADGAILLCGDTLFSLGCGRLMEGTADDMFASLAKLAALPPETLVCCGHEYTASNARFALTIDPTNQALIARAARVETLRATGTPTIPSRLSDELTENPFLRARSASELKAIRAAKDAF